MKFLLILVCFILSIVTHAQSQTITGVVKDSSTLLPLENCIIYLNDSRNRTQTDKNGKFKIDFANLSHTTKLIISNIGYESDTQILNGRVQGIIVFLRPKQLAFSQFVVTGVSKATLIKENPVSIVSVPLKAIEQATESNIIDALVKNVPGLNAVKTSPNISKPFIRGLGYNRVLTLYDGVRQEGQQWGDEHGIEVDAYNINNAEVIKGPASLMYGSDALAGVVSLFPYIPSLDDGKLTGKFTSEYQSNNNLFGNGLRLGYSNKHFLFATRGSYRVAKNYRNSIDGRVYNTGFDEKNLSFLFGYKTSKGFSHFNLTLYDNLQGIPDGSRDSLTRRFTKQIFEGANDDIKNRQLVSDKELNAYQLSPLHQQIKHYRVYMHSSYNLRKGDLDMLFAFQQNIRKEYNHPTMPNQAGMSVRLNTLNYGFRYSAPKFHNIETSIGCNGMLQNNKNKDATDFPIPNYSLFDGGIYFYGKWKYSKWTISGGIRNDIRQIKIEDFYVKNNVLTGFDRQVNINDTVNAKLQYPSYRKNFGGLSASLGATYQITKQIAVKGNLGRGYRAPNITEIASNGLDPGAHIIYLGNRNFNPEFSFQQDLGASAKFKNISAELSLFNNHINNYIYLKLMVDENQKPMTDGQGNKTYQYQQASAQLYGMEAWLSIHPVALKGFLFDHSFSMVYGFNRKSQYSGEGINGEYLPLIPPLKLLSSISQKVNIHSKIFKSVTPKMETEFSAAQTKFLGLNNTETSTASFFLLNVGISTEIKYNKSQILQLQFQVNNVFDKSFQSNLNRLKYFEYFNQSANNRSGMYNMGRNFCLKMVLPF